MTVLRLLASRAGRRGSAREIPQPASSAQLVNGPPRPDTPTTESAMASGTRLAVPSSYIRLLLTSLGAGYLRIDKNYNVADANSVAANWLGKSLGEVVGRPFAEVAPRSPMKMLSGAVERSVFVDRQLLSYSQPDRWLDLHVYPAQDGAIIFFKDITGAKADQDHDTAQQALLQSLDTVETQVIVLDKEGNVVASNLAWRSFAAAHGFVSTSTDPLNYLTLRSKRWAYRPEAKRVSAALSAALAGTARATHLEYAWQLKGKVHWFKLKAVPFDRDGDRYLVVTNEDVTALKQAAQIAADLSERLLGIQEEERERIAQALHDSTAQHLIAVGLNLMRLKGRGAVESDVADLFKDMEASLQEASKELRTLTYLLHPPHLAERGLLAALQQYVEGFRKRTGLTVTLRTTRCADMIPHSLRTCIYRIVQEALTNVHRHASAAVVQIALRHVGATLHLLITDDGRGISREKEVEGVGLAGIKARLQQLGGQLRIASSNRGTHLHAALPLNGDLGPETQNPSWSHTLVRADARMLESPRRAVQTQNDLTVPGDAPS